MEGDKKIVFATPVRDLSSSVFLTPPLSDRPTKTADMMGSQNFMLIQNLLLTPQSQEKPRAVEDDIVTRLYIRGFPLIVEKIFNHLSQADLKSCVGVCSRWKLFCTNLMAISSRLPVEAEDKLQRQKENLVAKRGHKKQTERHPLATQNPNILSQLKATPPPSISKMKQMKCPNCSSPAKEYNFVHAECLQCSYSFCPSCLGKAHSDNHSCKRMRSPTKRVNQLSIGTKQSKKRLRRL